MGSSDDRRITVGEEVVVDFATGDDDAELRRLLRETPMPGTVSLTMQREPSYARAATIEGDTHRTVTAREVTSGRLVGLGSRSAMNAYVNGRLQRLGYFGHVRIEPRFRGGKGLLKRGFSRLKEQHDREDAPFCFTTIIEDNLPARRALGSGWAGLPTYRELDVITSLAIPLWRPRRVATRTARYTLRTAGAEDLPDLAECLQRHHARYQLAPCWTAEDLASPERTRGLAPHDFTVAESNGKIVACCALWDQTPFKQIVVHDLKGALRTWRPLVNRLGPAFGVPRLPLPGQPFRFAFLSHLALPADDADLALALVTQAQNRALHRGYAYVSLGLSVRHPLLKLFARTFRHISYRAILYAAHWEDGAAAVDALDRGLIPHVEVATL